MMSSFWPTTYAQQFNAALADGMNKKEKIVFSNTLQNAEWANTRIVKGNIIEETRKLKQIPGMEMVVLGSGSIINQFAEAGLVDEFQFMLHPVVLGEGTPIFSGLEKKLNMKLNSSRIFKSGKILLCYEAV